VLDEAIARGDEEVSALAFFYKLFAAGHGESLSPHEMESATRARLEDLGDDGSPRVLASGNVTLAQALFWGGNLAAAQQAADRAIALARRAGDAALEKHAGGLLLGAWGHGEKPWAEIERDVVPPPVPGLDVRSILVASAAHQGRLAEARRISAELVEDLRARGQIVEAASSVMGIGWFELIAGELARAEESLHAAWVELGELGERGFRSTIGAQYADVLARQGRLDEAAAVVDEAEAISTPDDWVTVLQATNARAWIAVGRGEAERAVELARHSTELADRPEYTSTLMDSWLEYGEILLAVGRRGEAAAALARSREVATRKGSLAHVRRIDGLLAATETQAAQT
jgi:tetratricopeptide (TPR) repeat protein